MEAKAPGLDLAGSRMCVNDRPRDCNKKYVRRVCISVHIVELQVCRKPLILRRM